MTRGFRVKNTVRNELSRRERRVMCRIDKANWSGKSPMIVPPAIRYELADRVQAMTAGGLGVIQQMVKQLDPAGAINRLCPIFKVRLPYSEADHVLNNCEQPAGWQHLHRTSGTAAEGRRLSARTWCRTHSGPHHRGRFLSPVLQLGCVRTAGILS